MHIIIRLCVLGLLLLAASSGAEERPPALEYRITGIDKPLADNLRLHLGTLDAELAQHPQRLERIVRKAVTDALQPFGYYDATVAMEPGTPAWRIVVNPGPRIAWAGARIELDAATRELPAIRALLARAPFTAGTPLSHPDYDAFRDELLRSLRQLGFFRARYTTRELRVDRGTRTARAVLVLETGVRFRFATLEVRGTRLDPALLATLAPWRPGEGFDGAQLQRFERRLRDTGYFEDLSLRVRRETPDAAHVVVEASDVLTSRYDLGAGFSTDSKLRLRFNRSSPQLNAKGHSLLVESEFSEPRQTLQASLRIPHRDPLDDVFELHAGLQGERIEDTDSLAATVGARHTLKLPGDWSWSQGVGVELERYTIASESEKDVAYLMPVTSLARTRIDPGTDPLHGHSLWTALDASDESLGAPTGFVRWRGRAKWLQALPDDNTALLLRAEFGAIWTDAFNRIPASLRFDAGGDQSIRGYDLDSLGPRDANGELLGGRYLAVGSVEVSRRVAPHWRVALFVDGGGAFTERNDDLYQSAGIGVRWLSPVGQIRLDLAVPVADEENSGLKLHLSMGPPL